MRYLSQNCHQVTSVIRIVDGVYDARLYLPWSETVRDCHYVNFFPGLFFLFYPHFFSFGVVEVTGLGCLDVEFGFWGWGSLYKHRGITMGINNYTFQYSGVYCINLWLMILQVEKISFTDDSAYVVMGIADTRLFFMMICDVKIKEQMDRAMVRSSTILTFIWPCGILDWVPRLLLK